MSALEIVEKITRMSRYHCATCTAACTDRCAAYRVITRLTAEHADAVQQEGKVN